MNKFEVCRAVDMDEDQCNDLAVSLLEKLVSAFGGSYARQGSNFAYKHNAGVNALVEPREGELAVKVKLGIMASALAPQIKQEMNRAFDTYIDEA